jgi:IclR family mhp operon transcriptional activator
MPIRLDGRVLGCVNLTWRRKVMTVVEGARRHLDDLRGAVSTIEQRALDAGVEPWDRTTANPAPPGG